VRCSSITRHGRRADLGVADVLDRTPVIPTSVTPGHSEVPGPVILNQPCPFGFDHHHSQYNSLRYVAQLLCSTILNKTLADVLRLLLLATRASRNFR
jgi:hypothetical protein